jgi:hypothetical protein
MTEPFDYWMKSMEKIWQPWLHAPPGVPWMPKPEMPFKGKWAAWIGAMRSTYDVNMSWWQTFVEQSEELFLKMYKDSPMYNVSAEEQIRGYWQNVKELQKTQQEAIREQFEKMEALLKECDQAP